MNSKYDSASQVPLSPHSEGELIFLDNLSSFFKAQADDDSTISGPAEFRVNNLFGYLFSRANFAFGTFSGFLSSVPGKISLNITIKIKFGLFSVTYTISSTCLSRPLLLLPAISDFSAKELLFGDNFYDITVSCRPSKLVELVSDWWYELANCIVYNDSVLDRLSPRKLEEFVAGAFKESGFSDVILTPRSKDRGLDVIAYRAGRFPQRIGVSVKAVNALRQVRYDDIRSLIGAMDGVQFTNGQLITTGLFPPQLADDPVISAAMKYRIQLIGRRDLISWVAQIKLRK